MALNIIAGIYQGKKLSAGPPHLGVRPTSNLLRGALFDISRGLLPGSTFLDLFAGSGAVGFEALSQGARCSVLVESHPEVFKILSKNSTIFEGGKFQLHRQSSHEFCKDCTGQNVKFDVIFVDPPFDMDFTPLFDEIRPIIEEKGSLFIQFPTRTPPAWVRDMNQVKKYGESSLAIFYN